MNTCIDWDSDEVLNLTITLTSDRTLFVERIKSILNDDDLAVGVAYRLSDYAGDTMTVGEFFDRYSTIAAVESKFALIPKGAYVIIMTVWTTVLAALTDPQLIPCRPEMRHIPLWKRFVDHMRGIRYIRPAVS